MRSSNPLYVVVSGFSAKLDYGDRGGKKYIGKYALVNGRDDTMVAVAGTNKFYVGNSWLLVRALEGWICTAVNAKIQ